MIGIGRAFVVGVADGATVPAALAVGLGAIAVIVACRRWLPAIPGVLIAAVGGTAIVGLLGLATSAGVPVVGPLPQGLPTFGIPAVSIEDLAAMVAGGLAIAVVSMADTSVLSRTLAARGGEQVDQNQELLALGVANAGAGLFHGFSISASASRTPVAEQAGAKTQLAGVVGALTTAALLVVAPGLTTNLPQAVLAAIVMTACLSLVDIGGLVRLWRLRPSEFALSIVCFARRRARRRRPGHLLRGRAGARGVHLASLAAVLGDPRAGGRPQGLPRRDPLPGSAAGRRARPVPLGRPAVLRERGALPRAGERRRDRPRRRRRAGSWSPPNR